MKCTAGKSFTDQFNSGETQFAPFTNGGCVVPQNLAGEVYMLVTNAESVDDSVVLAG